MVSGCKSSPEHASALKDKELNDYRLKIAYNVFFDHETDNYEVFCMELDGSDVQNISALDGVEWTYHAHGDQVYFVSDKDSTHRVFQLYKMKADGTQKRKLSPIRLKDSWHSSRKEGSEFIIYPHETVDTAFYIIDSNSKILREIRPALKYFSDPTFSPDGSHIAFRGAQYASKREKGFKDEIFIMKEDGSDLRQLTHYPESDTAAAWYAYKAAPPKWHPTENFISYSSFQNGKYSLFGISVDGQKQWKLTNNVQGEVYHDWSPDGKWLVTDLEISAQGPYHIGLVNWGTKETKILTDTLFKYQQAPVFVKVFKALP